MPNPLVTRERVEQEVRAALAATLRVEARERNVEEHPVQALQLLRGRERPLDLDTRARRVRREPSGEGNHIGEVIAIGEFVDGRPHDRPGISGQCGSGP